jgi:hypothetical protein
MTVADYCIGISKQHTAILKSDLMNEVINNHPYLYYAAYFFQFEELKNEKYYCSLKAIIAAQYPSQDDLRHDLIMRLSKHKRNEDTSFISNELSRNWQGENDSKFALIENNPIDEYFFIIEKFYKQLLNYSQRELLQEMFWKDQNLERTFKNFVSATAAYKSKRSAEILLDIVKKKLYNKSIKTYREDYRELIFKYDLLESIKRYNCPYYKNIFPLIEGGAKRYMKKYSIDPMEITIDSNLIDKTNTW